MLGIVQVFQCVNNSNFVERFLLAKLQIDRLHTLRTRKKIRLALSAMPTQLSELYDDSLDRIKKQPGEDGALGMRILGWILRARRPLMVDELRHGLAVDLETCESELDEDDLLSTQSLVDVCAGLVIIDLTSQVIRLVHFTAQEYFSERRLKIFQHQDKEMAAACLAYLLYDITTAFPSDGIISESLALYPFLSYASLNWLFHLKRSSEEEGATWSKCIEYVNDSKRSLFSSVMVRKLLRLRNYTRLSDAGMRAGQAALPLETAAEGGLKDHVIFLLDHVSSSVQYMDSALNYAATEGREDVVKVLVERGADIESLAIDGSKSTHKACKRGHVPTARYLIEKGAKVNVSDRWGWTPLHHAANGMHAELVELLLDHDARTEARTPLGLTPCHIAASQGDQHTIRLLVDRKANLDAVTHAGYTPLHFAAEGGRFVVASILLNNGCDMFAVTKTGQTAQALVPQSLSYEARGLFLHIQRARSECLISIQSSRVPSLPS